jgi:hypothetical protein|tara:strand:- start:224 stop:616 length:393 start_codon:yes stop_codon:yes gene_type:complete
MSQDYELFEGKSLSSLFKDIYDNSVHNKKQLEVLVKEVAGFIKDGDMAVQLIPMIKEYLDINVKNDEQLVKLATVVQRLIAAEARGGSDSEFGLSDSEKEQLLTSIDEVVVDIQKKSDEINKDISEVKEN